MDSDVLRVIGQVINEVRREKNVSLAQISALGISKSRYYRFTVGEIDMTMIDMMSIMDALTMSFTELGQLTGETCFQDISIRQLMTSDVTELVMRTQKLAPQESELRRLLFKTALAMRIGESLDELIGQMYEQLVKFDAFTLNEMTAFALVAPELSVSQFKQLYLRYAQSMANYQNYLTSDMYDAILTIHLVAVDKLMLKPENRNCNNTQFVIETILSQYSEPQYMELRLLQQMMQLLKTTVDGIQYTMTNRIAVLLASAKNQKMTTLHTRLIAVDLSALWEAFQMTPGAFWQNQRERDAFPRFSSLPDEEMFAHYGEVLRWIVKKKHVTQEMIIDGGISTYKLYRSYKEAGYLELAELIKLMQLLDLMPADIDAVMRRRLVNVTNTTWHQYNCQHIKPLGYDAMARSMHRLYEENHLRKDLEAYFEFKALDGLFVRQNWLVSDEAKELSEVIGNELMGMETWHAAEFRVLRYALLHVDTEAGVAMWSRLIRKALRNAHRSYIERNSVLDIFEWAILRAMLQNNRGLAKALLLESHVLTADPIDILAFSRGKYRLFEIYEEMIDEAPNARRQLQEHLSDFVIITGNSKFTDAYQKILRLYWEEG